MSDQTPARSFGSVVDAYDRARPSYPREAAVWLVGDQPTTVLELGAGTGKLTEVLVALGHDVHATDPDEAMLAKLRERLPDVRTSVAGAEKIPAADAAYDVVVSAQAFHWFDHERALPEIARVLKPAGRLAVVWNQRDERIPWVRRLGALIGSQEQQHSEGPLVTSPLFGFVESEQFRFWQVVDRSSILTWCYPGPTSRCSTRPGAPPSWPRCSPSTTTTAAAWTACSCPTPRPASARASSTGRSRLPRSPVRGPGPTTRAARRRPTTRAGSRTTGPTPTSSSSTSAEAPAP